MTYVILETGNYTFFLPFILFNVVFTSYIVKNVYIPSDLATLASVILFFMGHFSKNLSYLFEVL